MLTGGVLSVRFANVLREFVACQKELWIQLRSSHH